MKVFFFGTGEIGIPSFHALAEATNHQLVGLITQPDRPAGRSRELRAPAIKTEAVHYHIPVFQPEKIKTSSVLAQIRNFQPDIGIVVAYGQILPKEILELPRYGCLNLHVSLLPKYRGASPIQAAIANGDRETGISVMYMDEGLDTGDVLLQAHLTISKEDTAATLHDKLASDAPEVLLKALDELTKNRAPRIPQDGALASYAPKIKREDAKIEWNLPAEVIEHRIRAYQPWPGAYTDIPVGEDGYHTVKVFSASVVSIPRAIEPGMVLECVPEGIVIAAATEGILVRSLQPEGRRLMTTEEFVRGNTLRVGIQCR
ncbi:MAG: methionyl-tRNA formyltransferase [Chthoniobacterales bacterium]